MTVAGTQQSLNFGGARFPDERGNVIALLVAMEAGTLRRMQALVRLRHQRLASFPLAGERLCRWSPTIERSP